MEQLPDGCMLKLPPLDYPAAITCYHDPYYNQRMPVEWYVPAEPDSHQRRHQYLRLDERLKALWQQPALIRLYASPQADRPVLVRLNSLSQAVHLWEPNRYHADIAPLLIKEWMRQGSINDQQIAFCQEKRQMTLLLQVCMECCIALPEGLKVEIAYVLDIDTSTGMLTLFSLKHVRTALGQREVSYDQLKQCIWTHNGDHPDELHTGDLLLCCKSRLTLLSPPLIDYIRRQARWGFVKGVVERPMAGGKVSILVEGTKVNFVGERLAQGVWMEKDQQVIMFPIVNPKNKYCAEARHILPIE